MRSIFWNIFQQSIWSTSHPLAPRKFQSKIMKKKLQTWTLRNTEGDRTTRDSKLENCNKINGPSPLNLKSRQIYFLPKGKRQHAVFLFSPSLSPFVPPATNMREIHSSFWFRMYCFHGFTEITSDVLWETDRQVGNFTSFKAVQLPQQQQQSGQRQ